MIIIVGASGQPILYQNGETLEKSGENLGKGVGRLGLPCLEPMGRLKAFSWNGTHYLKPPSSNGRTRRDENRKYEIVKQFAVLI